MYAKIYEQIFDSSIAENYQVRHVFEDLLKLADRDGIVNRTHEAIARRTNVPLDIVKMAITELEKPDPRSQSKDHEGRRIVRLDPERDWGWQIVNHGYYRRLKTDDDRRAGIKERVRKHREQKRLEEKSVTHVTECDTLLNASASVSPEDGSGKKPNKAFRNESPWTPEEWQAAVKSLQCLPKDAETCWAFYDSQGWHKSNGRPISGDPRSLLTAWMANPRPEAQKKKLNYAP